MANHLTSQASDRPEFPPLICAHVWISGQVQGVYYRGSAQVQARQLGINGWVRNLADGRVEAYLEGSPTQVAAMIAWCQQGPPSAVVNHVHVEYDPPTGIQGFQIRR